MSARPKRKLCWNCEGNVQIGLEMCPYCGVSVDQAGGEGASTHSKGVKSPYTMVKTHSDQSIPASPFASASQAASLSQADENGEEEEGSALEKGDETKLVIVTMAMLMVGTVFFLFGLILLLFSQDGYLKLRWNEEFWFVYALIGLPLLYLGMRNLGKFNEGDGFHS